MDKLVASFFIVHSLLLLNFNYELKIILLSQALNSGTYINKTLFFKVCSVTVWHIPVIKRIDYFLYIIDEQGAEVWRVYDDSMVTASSWDNLQQLIRR